MTVAAVSLVPTLATLRDLAVETLCQLMSLAAPPRERRLAATAALRYIAHLEKLPRRDGDATSTPAAFVEAEPPPIPEAPRRARATGSAQTKSTAAAALTFHPAHDCGIEAARPRASFTNLLDSLSLRRARSRRVAGAISVAAGAAPALGP